MVYISGLPSRYETNTSRPEGARYGVGVKVLVGSGVGLDSGLSWVSGVDSRTGPGVVVKIISWTISSGVGVIASLNPAAPGLNSNWQLVIAGSSKPNPIQTNILICNSIGDIRPTIILVHSHWSKISRSWRRSYPEGPLGSPDYL